MTPSPVRWAFATATSPAPLVYGIFPAGPGKLLKELRAAETRQLVGGHLFQGEERRIETTDQIARAVRDALRVVQDRRGPFEGEVLEHGPENGIAEEWAWLKSVSRPLMAGRATCSWSCRAYLCPSTYATAYCGTNKPSLTHRIAVPEVPHASEMRRQSGWCANSFRDRRSVGPY
jgi:hypothetical protein